MVNQNKHGSPPRQKLFSAHLIPSFIFLPLRTQPHQQQYLDLASHLDNEEKPLEPRGTLDLAELNIATADRIQIFPNKEELLLRPFPALKTSFPRLALSKVPFCFLAYLY